MIAQGFRAWIPDTNDKGSAIVTKMTEFKPNSVHASKIKKFLYSGSHRYSRTSWECVRATPHSFRPGSGFTHSSKYLYANEATEPLYSASKSIWHKESEQDVCAFRTGGANALL